MIDLMKEKSSRREKVFQMLFSLGFNEENIPQEVYESFFEDFDDIPSSGYIHDTYFGTVKYIPEADLKIEADSKSWRISRMSGVTRAILRLAVYEMLKTDTPARVAINEAIELSKKFDDDSSPSFINGILNRIGREEGRI